MVKGYSAAQIRLHWVVAVLIVAQIVFHEPMVDAWRTVRTGAEPAMSLGVWAHIIGGVLVLAFALWRLALRLTRGAPAAPAQESAPLRLAAAVGHWALYALMVLVPLSGLAAWYGGIEAAAEGHEVMKTILIIVVLVHVLAALWHQFWLKDNLLDRMRTPEK